MTPPSMESIFIILSGVILAAGILYWFWSHIQLTQKKVQLLENVVFELRGMVGANGSGLPGLAGVVPASSSSPALSLSPVAASPSAYRDLEDDDWDETGEEATEGPKSTPLDQLEGEGEGEGPGGRINGVIEERERSTEEIREMAFGAPDQFREMFQALPQPQPQVEPKAPESLDSMPVKELRRLAEQRGLPGAADMRKKEILSALRKQIGGGITLEVEHIDETVGSGSNGPIASD